MAGPCLRWESEAKLKMRGGDFITKFEGAGVVGHGGCAEQLYYEDPFLWVQGG
jgi:hypothetical protein